VRQLQRYASNPVITKGSTYDGWPADALAAPGWCWNADDEVFALTVSAWDDTAEEWASVFFTSTDLVTWSYVTGSLKTPSGSNLHGNAGLEYFDGEYWWANCPNATNIEILHGTDLVNWTNDGGVTPGGGVGNDASLRVNPHNGKLELWYMEPSVPRDVMMSDTPDGVTWTDRGVFLSGANNFSVDFGEPDVFYPTGSTARYMLFDGVSVVGLSGQRHSWLAVSADRDTTWEILGSVLGPSQVNAWENVNVFDNASAGVFDLGSGPRLYSLYAGGDVASATDGTNSSIGLTSHEWVSGHPAAKRFGGVSFGPGFAQGVSGMKGW
jgi:hypothetical protein